MDQKDKDMLATLGLLRNYKDAVEACYKAGLMTETDVTNANLVAKRGLLMGTLSIPLINRKSMTNTKRIGRPKKSED